MYMYIYAVLRFINIYGVNPLGAIHLLYFASICKERTNKKMQTLVRSLQMQFTV